ncbi:hypothetical protein ACRRTK_012437 [Alexandromys fortis]
MRRRLELANPDTCSLHPLTRKTLFATDEDHYRKPQPNKLQIVEPSPKDASIVEISHSRKRDERLQKSAEQGVCCETVSHGNIRSYTHKISPILLPTQELSKDNSKHTKIN